MIKPDILRALQKIGGIFSALNVAVVVGGNGAYTDGKTIHIPVPKSDVDFSEVTALLLHEAGHVRFTDFEAGKGNRNQLLHQLVNALEDPRIEKKISEVYGGAGYLFRKQAEEVDIPVILPNIGKMNPVTSFVLWVLTKGFSAMGNDAHKPIEQEVEKSLKGNISDSKLKLLTDLIGKELPIAKDTWEVVRLAEKVFDIGVEELRENLIYKPQRKDDDSSDSDSNSGGSGGVSFEYELDDSEDSDDSDSDNSDEKNSSSSSTSSETDSSSEDSQGNPSQESSQDSSSQKGNQDDSSQEGSQDSSSSKKGDGSENKSKSSEKDESSEEGKSKPDDKKKGKGDDSSKEEKSKPSTSSKGGDGDSSVSASFTYEPLSNTDRNRWDAQLEDEGYQVEADLIPDQKTRLEQLADAESDNYGDIYITKRVEGELLPFTKESADKRLDKANQLKNLKSILQKFLISKSREFCYLGDSGKKVDTRRLARLGLWDTKVFRKKDVQPGINTGLVLLADTSGSINDWEMEDEFASCIAIAQTLVSERNVKVGFYTFSSDCREVIPLGAKTLNPYLAKIGTEPQRRSTDLAKALNTVEMAFTMNPCERQAVIVLTDGEPDYYPATKEVAERVKSKGVELYGLYIGWGEMENPDLFTTVQNVTSYEQVPQALMEFSKRILR